MVVFNYSIVSNKNRTSGDDQNFTIASFSPPYSRFFRLRRATFYNLIFNISAANNQIKYTIASTTRTATIAPGAYDYTTLLTAVNNALIGYDGTNNLVAVYSDGVGKTPVPLVFTANGGTSVAVFDFSGPQSAAQVLGFSSAKGTTYTMTGITPFQTPFSYNLGYPDLIYICSSALTSYDSQIIVPGGNITNCLAVIPVEGAYGVLTDVEIRTNFSIYPKQNKIIDIQLRDRNNNIVNLQNSEFTMEFLLTDTVEGLWGS